MTLTTTTNIIDIARSSYGRCILKPGFLDRFYELFLAQSPKIAQKFKHTNMEAQKKVLKTGLANMIAYAQGKPSGKIVIDRLAKSHSRDQLDIPPQMYPLWTNSLIKALSEYDRKWTPETQVAWKELLDIGVKAISAGY